MDDMIFVRAIYGKPNQTKDKRDYGINGMAPYGNIKDIKEHMIKKGYKDITLFFMERDGTLTEKIKI